VNWISSRITSSKDLLGISYVLMAALTVALLPNTAKLALNDGVNTSTLLLSRGFIGLAVLSTVLAFTKTVPIIPKHLIFQSVIAGLSAAFFIVGLYQAIQSIEISLALLLLYLYPVGVAVINHFSGQSRLTVFRIAWSSLALFGIFLSLANSFDTQSMVGVGWALMAMVFTVAVTIANDRPSKEMGALTSNFYLTLWGTLLFTAGFMFFGELSLPQSHLGWIGLITNGSVYCFTWLVFFAGANLIGTTRASMISVSDLLFTAVLAYILFGEWFTLIQWTGFFIVFFSLIALESPKGFWSRTFRKLGIDDNQGSTK
jgi:drug/metabolite transporter (DMT)-like permease